uniref:hypothetical protein n=1 Tax=Burkholderia sp. D-99 TaxID=2717316 RepID=UPI001FB7E420|nr:hypothetical protein [Burkholderia sp. D-99]
MVQRNRRRLAWIRMAVNGQARHCLLDRALTSRGTPCYDTISGEHGLLLKGERKNLLTLPLSIAAPAMRAGAASAFMQVLQESGGE